MPIFPLRLTPQADKPPSVARVQDGTVRIYWGPNQWGAASAAGIVDGLDYQAPGGWPQADYPLDPPRVVRLIAWPADVFEPSARGPGWTTAMLALKATLESTYPGVFVTVAGRKTTATSSPTNDVGGENEASGFGAFLQDLTPRAEDQTPWGFLGGNVVNVIPYQDTGNPNASAYYQNLGDQVRADPPSTFISQYEADYDALAAVYPYFPRHSTYLFVDNGGPYAHESWGITSGSVHKEIPRDWAEAQSLLTPAIAAMVNGTGDYAGRPLSALGFTLGAATSGGDLSGAEAFIKQQFGLM